MSHYTKHNSSDIHAGVSTYLGYGAFHGEINGQVIETVLKENGRFENGVTTGAFTFADGSGRYFLLDGKMMIEID